MILSVLWLPATLGAAFFQSWRTAMQQRLRGAMSVNAAGLVRFLYGAPTALGLLLLHGLLLGGAMPRPGWAFLGWALVGGTVQILGTNLLIMSFSYRNFVVGTAYSKTDAMQGAILGTLVLGEVLRPLAWLGVLVSVAGVLVLSLAGKASGPRDLLRATVQPAALCGLGAGLAFAATGMFTKLAMASLPPGTDAVRGALVALTAMNILQSLMQGGWMLWREPEHLRAVFRGWRKAAPVGALSALGSACWFTGFALAPLGLVRAVGAGRDPDDHDAGPLLPAGKLHPAGGGGGDDGGGGGAAGAGRGVSAPVPGAPARRGAGGDSGPRRARGPASPACDTGLRKPELSRTGLSPA
ncbi:DMT family transporter [Roseomonas gilardii subsp. gilardii]|uniref:DMT family transporter n=1 Tax=Roseomonas gilardii TaxID=257708 RepID=UPI001FF89283|nr:DMT family transporter [Roseomonas gilardii]UPG73539.1 DMT family transporter [Roseomonas gilardii subsp. gilardii]